MQSRGWHWLGHLMVAVLLLLSLVLIIPLAPVRAAVITVDSLTDGAANALHCASGHTPGTCRLRDAIAAAAANDVVTFIGGLFGPITLNQTAGTLVLGRNITIVGPGASILQIDGGCMGCDPTGTPAGGVTVFSVSTGVTAQISGLTIQHGNDTHLNCGANSESCGGGIFSRGTLMVTDSVLSANAVRGSIASGGGLYVLSGPQTTLTNTTFINNTAVYNGGGIESNSSGGTLTITHCTFLNNIALDTGNIGSSGGGALLTINSTTILNSTFSGNAARVGGAITNLGGALTVLNSTFASNTARTTFGGGIADFATSSAIVNSTFTNNSAAVQGGGVYASGGPQTVVNNTFSANTAPAVGVWGTVE
ncbi:MAG: hypothetical protein ACYDAR_13490 [Thermomicrobiales bacterium]